MRTIKDLNSTHFFVAVVQAGSFTEASRRLGIPKSTLSEKVSALEKQLDASLLIRTTRKLRLTDVGHAYFKKVESALDALSLAESEATMTRDVPFGILRITAPSNSASHVILKAIAEYKRKFPQVKVEVNFSDKLLDLVEEGFDIAFRPGHLRDSSLIAKKIGKARRILVASPRYLKSAPLIKHPRDLKNHTCIGFIPDSRLELTWPLKSHDGRIANIEVDAGVSTNSLQAVKELVLNGNGIALLPNSICRQELAQSTFTHLLKDWATEENPVHLVYPPRRHNSAKVREMIPLLERALRDLYS